MNLNTKSKDNNRYPITVSADANRQYNRILLPYEQVEKYQNILKNYSDNNINDKTINFKKIQERLAKSIYFSMTFEEADDILLKCFTIHNIACDLTLSDCKRKLFDCYEYFAFINNIGIHFESTNNICLKLFVKNLDSNALLSDAQRKSIASSVRDLLEFAMRHGIFRGKILIIEPYESWNHIYSPKRAPDHAVMKQLDAWFFNLNNEIPLDFRCMYLILRLILGRFTEAQSILLDDIRYPQDNMFSLRIPTFKETPLHIPFYNEYTRFIDGRIEQILFHFLVHQQQYAYTLQNKLSYADRGYLFVSSNGSSLLTNEQFNKYLEDICKINHIRTADGLIAHVTSHQLRHVGIVERNKSQYTSLQVAKKEANHSRIESTFGYSYQSEIDEFQDTKGIVCLAFKETIDNNPSVLSNEVLSKIKFNRFANQPFVRLIPGFGLCCDYKCVPQYEQCFKCKFFEADPCYKEYFLECVEIVKNRLEKYKLHASKKVIQFDKYLLAIYNLYLQKIEEKTDRYNYSAV